MKVLIFSIIFIIVKSNATSNDTSEDGWMVPQKDGSFKWISKDSLHLYRNLMARLPVKDKDFVQFYLYTRNISQGKKVSPDYHFNNITKTIFVIHGWRNDHSSDLNTHISNAYLGKVPYNMIIVDWSKYSYKTYIRASYKIQAVGDEVASFIEKSNLSPYRISIIGHSLGAHCAGLVGRKIQKGRISSIWALDPAGPLFDIDDIEWRIDPKDAKYVECVHTNAGKLGFTEPIGYADYYLNGGKSQPGCFLDITGSCSHSRSWEYMVESIIDNNFSSYNCTSHNQAMNKYERCTLANIDSHNMGYGLKASKGCYYTPTSYKSPFGISVA